MKRLIALAIVSGVFLACGNNSKTEQVAEEPAQVEDVSTAQAQLTGNFGEPISEDSAVSTESLLAQMEGIDSMQVKVESQILATCKMKGCWMNVELPGEDKMRVTFKDYGFFVPKEGVEGKTVIMEGYAKKATTDVETLRHFAKDAGKSQEEIEAITEPKDELTFVASGVIIK